ncbi:MAG: hypothetical protein WBA57_27540 [Elainellaceae cyanobacterium]
MTEFYYHGSIFQVRQEGNRHRVLYLGETVGFYRRMGDRWFANPLYSMYGQSPYASDEHGVRELIAAATVQRGVAELAIAA